MSDFIKAQVRACMISDAAASLACNFAVIGVDRSAAAEMVYGNAARQNIARIRELLAEAEAELPAPAQAEAA